VTKAFPVHLRSTGAQSGFTLIELLLSIAILSLISAAIVGGFDVSRRAWQVGRDKEFHGEIEAAVAALQRQVSQIVPAVAPGNGGMARLVFAGHRHDLIFVTLSDGRSQVGGMQLTRMGLSTLDRSVNAAMPSGKVRVWTTVLRAASAFEAMPADATNTILFDDVSSFDLSYFGTAQTDKAPAWHDEWFDQDHLPDLVAARVVIRAPAGSMTFTVPMQIHAAQ
jgi:general secretion pathway protein J